MRPYRGDGGHKGQVLAAIGLLDAEDVRGALQYPTRFVSLDIYQSGLLEPEQDHRPVVQRRQVKCLIPEVEHGMKGIVIAVQEVIERNSGKRNTVEEAGVVVAVGEVAVVVIERGCGRRGNPQIQMLSTDVVLDANSHVRVHQHQRRRGLTSKWPGCGSRQKQAEHKRVDAPDGAGRHSSMQFQPLFFSCNGRKGH
jgi:hypothetical protein